MSLPGDKRIDTDPQDDPDPLEIIEDICDSLEEDFSALMDAYKILSNEESSVAAERLAIRAIKMHARGRTHQLHHIKEQAVHLQEHLDTILETETNHA